MTRLAPGDKVAMSGDLSRIGTVAAGPVAPLLTTPPQALDTVLVCFEGDDTVEAWRRSVHIISRAPDGPCAFCGNKPLPNAARWIQRETPAATTCPRCGVTR